MKVLLVILICVLTLAVGALLFWGLGLLAVWAFKINYDWTFWHGLICQFSFMLLKQIFGGKNEKN